MPIILISLVIGLFAAGAALVYYWKNPSASQSSSDGTALLVLGIVFMIGGVGFVVAGQDIGYSWAPIGIVFLGVGARQRRHHNVR